MATKTADMSFSDLLRSTTIISDNIKLNSVKIGRFGLDLPAFTDGLDADVSKADALDKEQENLKSELKAKTEELKLLTAKLTQDYALAKKTVKLAEPQVNWVGYGITDKK